MALRRETKYTLLRCKLNKPFCTELCTCETEDESCNNLMLDGQSLIRTILSLEVMICKKNLVLLHITSVY